MLFLKMHNQNNYIFENDGCKYSGDDIYHALQRAGINPGDHVFVHSELKTFGKINTAINRDFFLSAFSDALQKAIGAAGTLLMPTFSYSFCKNQVFDILNTPSTVGILTEYFRTLPGAKRSKDPIFSISALGNYAGFYTDVGSNCFGTNSIFDKLFRRNAKILFLGNRFDITFMHYAEQALQVPYRYNKVFKGLVRSNGQLEERECHYYVRDLDQNVQYNLEGIADYIRSAGALHESQLGFGKIRWVHANDAFEIITNHLKSNIRALLLK